MVKNTPATDDIKAIEKKVKRPWRNKVRKQARKMAEKEQRQVDLNENSEVVSSKKKKSNKKKAKSAEETNQKKDSMTVEERSEGELPIQDKKESKLDSFKERLDAVTGAESFDFFKENPDAFEAYHKGFAKQVEKWPNHPLENIIKWLKNQKELKVVYDLGCGVAKIAEAVEDRHKVQSFDLVAANDRVTEADMANLPVEDSSADIVVFCLSLMGTNILDFVKEARRVLKQGGILKIAEVTSRFHNLNRFCDAICKMGFTQSEKRHLTDYFVMLQFNKIQKVENKRPLGLKLKPCLYKKR